MEIIDFNVHLTENDLWFGKKVNNIDRFIETLIKCNIKKAVIQPLKVNCNTEYVAKLCNNYPNYFYGFGTISTNDYKNERYDDVYIKSFENHTDNRSRDIFYFILYVFSPKHF